jgi:hypothetical protein
VEYSKNLKRNFSNDKDYTNLDDIQEVADYYNCYFTIYNNLFTIEAEIKSKSSKKNRKSSTLLAQHIKL